MGAAIGGQAYSASDGTEAWGTPQTLFDACSDRWGPFELDAAGDEGNAKCTSWLDSAFEQVWAPRGGWKESRSVWLNPPYGRGLIREFFRAAAHETSTLMGPDRVVMLVPANTDTKWFAEMQERASEIVFLTGRVRFVHPDGREAGTPAFGSALVVIEPGNPGGCHVSWAKWTGSGVVW